MKRRIKLSENKLHRIIKESVKRVLKEHHWDDTDFDEDFYAKPIDNEPGIIDDKEEQIGRLIRNYKLNPINTSMYNDPSDYFAGKLFSMFYSGNTAIRKAFDDMDICSDDIYHLWCNFNDERLRKICNDIQNYIPQQQIRQYISDSDFYKPTHGDLYGAARRGERFNGKDLPAQDYNLNVDTGDNGRTSLAAQGAFGERNQEIARNMSTTVRKSAENGRKKK